MQITAILFINHLIYVVYFSLTDLIWRVQLILADVNWWWQDIAVKFRKRDGMCEMEVEFWDI